MATVILPDGPGYGRGVTYVGDVDPGAVGAYAVWLEIPVSGIAPRYHVRNAANTAWITAGSAGLAIASSEVTAVCTAPPASAVAPGATLTWSQYRNQSAGLITAGAAVAAALAALGLAVDVNNQVFTVQPGGDGVFGFRLDAQPATGPTAHIAEVVMVASAGYSGYSGQPGVVIPSGATGNNTWGFGHVDAFKAGDTFKINVVGTAAEQDIQFVAFGITRIR